MDRAMTMIPVRSDEPLGGALARLEARWGSAAIRLGSGRRIDALAPTSGALALLPAQEVDASPIPDAEVVSTGFPALDAVLGTGGLPRRATASFRGDASSGKTTLALRCVTAAQAAGGIVAWLDLARAFDPLEAAARGVDLRWLVVLRPADPEEGLRLAGALVSGRAVDLLVLDLPPRLPSAHEALLRRLAAHARRVGVQLLVLEPAALLPALHGALAEAAGLRLELARAGWIRLGRDVVGQRTAVTVAKNRYGPPGRQVELEIRYLDDGERAAGVARLLDAASQAGGEDTGPPGGRFVAVAPGGRMANAPPGRAVAAPPGAAPRSVHTPPTPLVIVEHAPPPPRLAPSPAPPRAGRPRPALDTGDAARPRRAALGAGGRARSQSGRGAPRRPPRPAAGERP
jgi:recombination protein RecA